MTDKLNGFGDYFKNPDSGHGLGINSIFNKYKMLEVRTQHKNKKKTFSVSKSLQYTPPNENLLVVPFKR